MTKKSIRILWLLNHTTLRRFEIRQLNSLGITEFYCPKRFPYDEGNLSASVDFSLDSTLSVPQESLAILNQQNWYESPSDEAWRIVNEYFDIAIIGFFPRQISSSIRNFRGSIVLRVFGLAKGYSYTKILNDEAGPDLIEKLRALGGRFWFGAGYEHLKNDEGLLFNKRNCFLPVGLEGKFEPEVWSGGDKRIFFVCPRIETSPYFKHVYRNFVQDFSGFGYQIGGAQPIRVNDPNVLGFVSNEIHERNMREMRVMYYHSSEPNHIHYHPFEAIRAGMPLVFMAGGILDRFGGVNLPGRCKTIKEARKKIERILNDDWDLIEAIRNSQVCLLEPMKPENCESAWREGFGRILAGLDKIKVNQIVATRGKTRIAVIVPVAYRGGSLRGAKLLAQAIELGSRQAGQDAEVVLAHLDDSVSYPDEEFADLPASIMRRPYKWQLLKQDEAYRAMAYSGHEQPMDSAIYQIPDDGIKQFMDCNLWIIVSDRLEHPLLPVRPYVLMVYDYLQRYESLLPEAINHQFINAAHKSERVLVTTEFTRQDAIQYAGISARKVCKVPMLAPKFAAPDLSVKSVDCNLENSAYFLWTTNLAPHKNHENALKGLRIYYEQLDGQLECRVTGVDTKNMLKSNLPHLKSLRDIVASSSVLKRQLNLLGELPDLTYQKQLKGSAFLWHAGRIDNGTFSVVEAAHFGVPALSSDYPAMREIDAQFGLNISWMDAYSPIDMAKNLKIMEAESMALRERLPSAERLATQSVEQLAGAYWDVVRECL